MSRLTVCNVTGAKVSETSLEGRERELTVRRPLMRDGENCARRTAGAKCSGLEETPEQRKVKDGLAVFFGKLRKAWCMNAQPVDRVHGAQRRANRRCAALWRSVQRPEGARLSAMLGMVSATLEIEACQIVLLGSHMQAQNRCTTELVFGRVQRSRSRSIAISFLPCSIGSQHLPGARLKILARCKDLASAILWFSCVNAHAEQTGSSLCRLQ